MAERVGTRHAEPAREYRRGQLSQVISSLAPPYGLSLLGDQLYSAVSCQHHTLHAQIGQLAASMGLSMLK